MGRTSDAKERLLESAGQLFHDRGYNAVGVSDICGAAQVNKGSFYHFYPSKQRLALEVVDAVWHGSREFLEETLLGDEPPLVRLRRYFDALYERHREACDVHGKQLGCPLGNLSAEMSTQDPLLRARLLQAMEGHIGYFEGLLREARGRGELPDEVDPAQAAETLVAFIEGQILLSKLRDDPDTLADLAPAALRLIGAAEARK